MAKRSMKKGRNMKRSRSRSMKRRGGNGDGTFSPQPIQPQPIQPQPIQPQPIQEDEEETIDYYTNKASETMEGLKGKTDQLLTTAEGALGDAQATLLTKVDEVKTQGSGFLSNLTGSSSEQPTTPVVTPVTGEPAPEEKKSMFSFLGFGGRRRSRSRQMKMKGGLNPAFGYNAAPVTDANVAEPTYMMTSGGKRRRRTCKKRRRCCKKSCRKHHRHHYKR